MWPIFILYQIPQYLFELGLLDPLSGARIAITQPRRVAAITVAKRKNVSMLCKYIYICEWDSDKALGIMEA